LSKPDAARLKHAIAALPPLFRETLVLRELQGFKLSAIGEITGVPIGNRDVPPRAGAPSAHGGSGRG